MNLGTSSPTGKFFACCVVLSSHEDTEAWSNIYKFVSDYCQIKPVHNLGDGAKAITNAGKEVFGDLVQFKRLMCWAHVHTNIHKHMKQILSNNKSVHDSLSKDINDLQWSVLNEDSFSKVFTLIEDKFIGKYDSILNDLLDKFFQYMRKVWVESTEHHWYEGAHPWGVSNNQGVEGKNMDIKLNYTFRKRLALGALITTMANMVTEWSEEDDKILESPRIAGLHGEKNSLALRTAGYHCYSANKDGNILGINNPQGKYTVAESEEFKLGKVNALWAMTSTAGETSGKTLKERAIERIANRRTPLSSSFDEFLRIRSSCWIIEERDGDMFCDCPVGMKGKLCKHTVGMLYHSNVLEPADDVRYVPLGEKRKRGRPKNLPNCLVNSPVRSRLGSAPIRVESEVCAEVAPVKKTSRKRKMPTQDIDPPSPSLPSPFIDQGEVQQSPVDALVRQQRRLQAGLGAPKPTKKPKRLRIEEEPVSNPKSPKLPPVIKCKKKKDTCNHKYAFGKHYDKSLFAIYEAHVKSKTSTVTIDPDYIV